MKTPLDFFFVAVFTAFLIIMIVRLILDWRMTRDIHRTMYQAKAKAVEGGMVQVVMPDQIKRDLDTWLHSNTIYCLEPFAAPPRKGDIPMWIVMRRPDVQVSER